MVIFIIVVLVIGLVFCIRWFPTYREYKKIGNFSDYKPISKTLNDKDTEYGEFQILGLKNINSTGIKFLKQLSTSVSTEDLKWLKECSEFLELGMLKAGISNEKVFNLPDKMASASLFTILKLIKKSRLPLPEHYTSMGCSTCGEAEAMDVLFRLRISQIENRENIKPHDMDFFYKAIIEIRNNS